MVPRCGLRALDRRRLRGPNHIDPHLHIVDRELVLDASAIHQVPVRSERAGWKAVGSYDPAGPPRRYPPAHPDRMTAIDIDKRSSVLLDVAGVGGGGVQGALAGPTLARRITLWGMWRSEGCRSPPSLRPFTGCGAVSVSCFAPRSPIPSTRRAKWMTKSVICSMRWVKAPNPVRGAWPVRIHERIAAVCFCTQ